MSLFQRDECALLPLLIFILLSLACTSLADATSPKPIPPLPNANQKAWQELELTMFCHFGVNTFTDREWGEGTEDPKIFNPVKLNCRQWAVAARSAGFKLMILTAKHHDGFCLWPSKYTDHCVKNSTWKNGKGDVVREFTDACRAEGLKVGLYLSPWDRHEPTYGTDAYNTHFVNQLTELLTQYGKIDEIWFDGACGEGPNGKRQVYDFNRYYKTIRKLAPHAVIAISGPDVRWVGNESGVARIGESSVVDGAKGKTWYPAECDVSIRPGWFYHASEDKQVKSLDNLLDIYLKSVGRNSVLLLNVPPNRDGLFSEADLTRLREFGSAIQTIFRENLTSAAKVATTPPISLKGHSPGMAIDANRESYWAPVGNGSTATMTIDFGHPVIFNVVSLREPFQLGERAQEYHLEAESVENPGTWSVLARGKVIGARNILAFPDTTARRVRLVIDRSRGVPCISELALFHTALIQRRSLVSLSTNKPAIASSVHPPDATYGADKAVDGDPDTRWATSDETRECWLQVDLEKIEAIGRVAISELAPRIKRFAIEYRSSESEPWHTALDGVEAGTNYEQTFQAVKARYVRLHIFEASDSPTIWEFQVFAP